MNRRNSKVYASSLGDLDERLLNILNNDENYLSENFKILPDGTIIAKSLFEKTSEDEKNSSWFTDLDKNKQIIMKYSEYADRLKSVKELDRDFLDRLNTLCTQYKSSAAYMERLVKRLLKHNFNYTDEALDGIETRVLILRQFIKSFGYTCVEKTSSPGLEDIVKNEFEGKIENITDDGILLTKTRGE